MVDQSGGRLRWTFGNIPHQEPKPKRVRDPALSQANSGALEDRPDRGLVSRAPRTDSRPQLHGGRRKGNGCLERVTGEKPQCGQDKVDQAMRGDPVSSGGLELAVAEADALPLGDQIGPRGGTAISDSSGGNVREPPAGLRQLRFEGGFVHDGAGVDGPHWRIERHHFPQLGAPARHGVEQIPLKVDNSANEVPSRVVRARPGARHADSGKIQRGQEAAKGARFWKNIATDQHHPTGGRVEVGQKPVDRPGFSAALGFGHHSDARVLRCPRPNNGVGRVGASAAHHAHGVVARFGDQALEECGHVARLVVCDDANFGTTHVQGIACSMPEHRDQVWIRVVAIAFFAHVGLGMWFVERGLLNADEGWYLYAARQVAMGFEPYRDFALFQPPVYPQVMAGTVDAGPGVLLTARWVSWVFLCIGTGATVLAASRLYGVGGAAIAAVGMGLHPVVVNHGVLAKPYGLTALLVGGGLLVLSGGAGRGTRTAIGFALMGLGVGTRISLAAPIGVLALAQPGRAAALAGLSAGLGLALHSTIGIDPTVLYDQWVGFHLGNGGTVHDRLGWIANTAMVWGMAWLAWWPGPRAAKLPGLRWAAFVAVLVHALPAALHVEHVVSVVPLLALACADRWGATVLRIPWALVVGAGLTAFAARPYVHLDTAVATVRQTMDLAAWLDANSPSDAPMITTHLALAVEADRSVVRGLEMAHFGWVSDLDLETAQRTHRMSSARLRAAVGRPFSSIVVGERDFDPAGRALLRAAAQADLHTRRTVEDYGQFGVRVDAFSMDGETLWTR